MQSRSESDSESCAAYFVAALGGDSGDVGKPEHAESANEHPSSAVHAAGSFCSLLSVPVAHVPWPVALSPWSMTCGPWPMACGSWPMACCLWPIGLRLMPCDSSYGLWPTERRRPSLALLSHFESCIATALDQRAVELEIENIVHMIELDDRVLLTPDAN